MYKRDIDVNNKDSYYFFVACRAILCAPDLTDAEKLVFIAFHGRENVEMSGDQPSMQNVGSWLGKDRRNIRRALDGLERKGYAKRTHRRNGRGTTVVDVETFLPTQAVEAGKSYLKRGRVTLRLEPEDDEHAVETPANGGVTLTPPKNAHPGGHLDSPDGPIRGGHLDPPLINKQRENKEPEKRPAESAGPLERPEESVLRDELRKVREKLRELNLEGESLEVQCLREEERSLIARIKDAEQVHPEPSTRPKWNGWRRRNPSNWRDADLVGYWVCRYRELRGSEDPAFAPCDSAYELRVSRTCRNYMELHLGASGERWRDAVDGILAKAEGAGHPVSIAYHILPRNPAVLASLDKPSRGGRRAPSPAEVNDAWGDDREHWDAKAAEIQEKRRRKAAKLGIPVSQVKLHVGEEVP